MIDMDTEREDVIRISKPEDIGKSVDDKEKARQMVLDDLTTVCNALGTLIHLSNTNGYMSKEVAYNMCIEFLNDNFLNKEEKEIETPKDDK